MKNLKVQCEKKNYIAFLTSLKRDKSLCVFNIFLWVAGRWVFKIHYPLYPLQPVVPKKRNNGFLLMVALSHLAFILPGVFHSYGTLVSWQFFGWHFITWQIKVWRFVMWTFHVWQIVIRQFKVWQIVIRQSKSGVLSYGKLCSGKL